MSFYYANDIPYLKDLENELVNSWLEIDLKKYAHNIAYIKKLISPKTKILQVVKADAYGHGAIQIAKIAQELKVDYLGVANVAEGKILRLAGMTLPILVLGSIFKNQIETALKNNLHIAMTSLLSFDEIEDVALKNNLTAHTHLKIDTGMGRVGVREEHLDEVIQKLKNSKHIVLDGVFTHFAESEEPNSDFTNKQLKTFEKALEKIKFHLNSAFIIHSANSSATLIHPESYFDMVRLGISGYGLGDPPDNNLEQVMSLKSKIINIKEIPEGNSLGYRRSFITKRNSIIGTVPLGYADGLPRILSNNQDVLIRGKRFPIVGNISMDQFLVDLTNLDNPEIGEEVVLLGKMNDQLIPIEEWAKKSYKITYEVLCGFGNRLPRKYV